jgi:hypothetical protein
VTDPLRVYADLYQEAVECRRRVDAIQNLLSRAAEALDKRPERFRFDGLDDIAMPRLPGEPFLAAADWPTAPQIQQVIADWHAAAARLSEAWETLWPRDRKLLEKSPPESASVPKPVGHSEPTRRTRPYLRPA